MGSGPDKITNRPGAYLWLVILLAAAGCRALGPGVTSRPGPLPRQHVTLEVTAADGTARPIRIAYTLTATPAGRRAGELTILVHGLGTNADTWNRVIEGLAEHSVVIALDQAGCGWSDAPRDLEYTPEQILALANAFAARAPALAGTDPSRPAVLAGQSLGGGFAALMAASHPERYRALILSAPAGYPFELPPLYRAVKGPFGPVLLWLGHLAPAGLVAEVVLDRPEVTTPAFGKLMLVQLRNPDHRHALLQIFRNTVDPAVARRLIHRVRAIRTPTLILWAGDDHLLPREHAERWHQDVQGSRLVIIDGCDHVVPEEATDRWLEEARSFLGWSR